MKHRTFIALIVSLGVAVTGLSSAPARAGNDEVRNLLTGLAAIGVIGAIVAHENKQKRKRRAQEEVSRRSHDHHRYHNRDHGQPYGHRYKHGHGHKTHTATRPLPHRVERKLLPAKCQRTVNTRYHGQVRGFGGHCLRNNFAYHRSLPRECSIQTMQNGRHYKIYKNRCLRSYGYQVSGRR